MKLKVYLEIDTPDTDIFATVFAINADGSTIKLGQDIIRARFRKGIDAMSLLKPGVVKEYIFDRFHWTSVSLKAVLLKHF